MIHLFGLAQFYGQQDAFIATDLFGTAELAWEQAL